MPPTDSRSTLLPDCTSQDRLIAESILRTAIDEMPRSATLPTLSTAIERRCEDEHAGNCSHVDAPIVTGHGNAASRRMRCTPASRSMPSSTSRPVSSDVLVVTPARRTFAYWQGLLVAPILFLAYQLVAYILMPCLPAPGPRRAARGLGGFRGGDAGTARLRADRLETRQLAVARSRRFDLQPSPNAVAGGGHRQRPQSRGGARVVVTQFVIGPCVA